MAASGFDPSMFMQAQQQLQGGVGNLASGAFINQGAPYHAAMGPYQQYYGQAANVQNPFLQAGQGAIGNYQNWLGGMQNPSGFMNNLMGQYQESPWAKYQQQQTMRSGINAASMGGLPDGTGGAGIGSSPFAQQLQQNSANISSQDMNNWISHVLGINTQYGAGQQNLMGMGQNAANTLSGLYSQEGQGMGNLAYGERLGENQNKGNFLSGLTSFL